LGGHGVTNSRKLAILAFSVLFALGQAALVSARPSGNNFKVGVIAPLSGIAAEYGVALKNGIELAKKENQGLFGSVDFILEDTPYEPKAAVSSFNKLRTVDKVDLVYVFGVAFCDVVAPLAQNYKVPMVAQCVQASVTKDRPYVVRFFNYSDQYARVLAEYLKHRDVRRIGVVIAEDTYLEEMYRALSDNISPEQSLTIVDRYQKPQMDFRSTVAKLRTENYDAVAVFLAAGQIAQFYKQLAEQRVTVFTFGTNFFESMSEAINSGKTMEGAVFANNLVRASFIGKYGEEYGNESQITFAAFGYEFAKLMGGLFANKERKLSAEEILAKVTRLEPGSDSAVGPAAYEDRAERGKSYNFQVVIKVIGDGKISVLDSPRAQLGHPQAR
jgi:branched-chain amino acid transport system substrate-binding protein